MAARLNRYQRIATRDLEEAREEVARVFCPHYLQLTSRNGHLDMLYNCAWIGGVGINYLRYGDEIRITPGTLKTFYLIQIPLSGRAAVKIGDRVVASDRYHASLLSPTEPVDMVWSAGCEQLLIYLRRDAVEEFAGQHGPGEKGQTVLFDPRIEMNAPAVRSWMRLVQVAEQDLESEGHLLSDPVVATYFEQVLIAGLLAAQSNSSSLSSPRRQVAPLSPAVRIALDMIESSPERPWRVAELAAHAGVSPRTLQDAFRRVRGTSPMGELRRVRLARAHTDLLDGTPLDTSVTEIATRWGFFHLGRFSQIYRSAFKELPSQTLAGARESSFRSGGDADLLAESG